MSYTPNPKPVISLASLMETWDLLSFDTRKAVVKDGHTARIPVEDGIAYFFTMNGHVYAEVRASIDLGKAQR